jgi:hypothetical protein
VKAKTSTKAWKIPRSKKAAPALSEESLREVSGAGLGSMIKSSLDKKGSELGQKVGAKTAPAVMSSLSSIPGVSFGTKTPAQLVAEQKAGIPTGSLPGLQYMSPAQRDAWLVKK